MSAWNIQSGPVGAVLTTVNGHLGDQDGTSGLTGHVKDLGDAVVSAAETCADSLPVSIALNRAASDDRIRPWPPLAGAPPGRHC